MRGSPDPKLISWRTIETVICKGSAKDGCNESWRDKDQLYHELKAIRHLVNDVMVKLGYEEATDEPHLKNAHTRTAMALTQD